MITKEQLAWAAGIFDGEGCITTCLPNRFQLRVEVKMTHKPTIIAFSEITGGKVSDGYERRGKKPQYRVRIYGSNALKCLEKFYPFLITKKSEAEIAFKIMEAKKEDRLKLDLKLRELKRISW
jgi:hypothetical protein